MQNLKMKREIMVRASFAVLVIFGSIDRMEHTCDYHGWFPQQLAVHQTRTLNDKPRSRAVSTERTILSPFTKEYRVLAAESGIRQFLEGFPEIRLTPTNLDQDFY
ncbi:hypothetical protein WN943_020576 [Citrus x changshan-huyou]